MLKPIDVGAFVIKLLLAGEPRLLLIATSLVR